MSGGTASIRPCLASHPAALHVTGFPATTKKRDERRRLLPSLPLNRDEMLCALFDFLSAVPSRDVDAVLPTLSIIDALHRRLGTVVEVKREFEEGGACRGSGGLPMLTHVALSSP